MKGISLLAIMLYSGMLTHTAQANTVTIDFEEFTIYTLGYNGLKTQGYTFSSDSGYAIHNHNTWDLSMSAAFDGEATLTLQQQSNHLFSLQQFDMYNLFVSDGSGTLDVELQVTGYQSGGGQVATTLYQADAFSLVELSGFDELEYVDFLLTGGFNPVAISAGGYWPVAHLDNFVIASVPIPAAVWLFGSGLIGLLGFPRKNKYEKRKDRTPIKKSATTSN